MKNMQAQYTAITNANIVLENGILWDGVLLLEGGKIHSFGAARDMEIPAEAAVINAKGAYVGPGFVDIHVHEGGKYTTYYEPAEAAEHFLRHGTTSLFATPYYSMTFDEIMRALRTLREAMGKVKTLKGVYMEGPYTNPDYGANSATNPWRAPIDEKQMRAMVDEAGEMVKVWTIAPEREGILSFLKYAKEVNPAVRFAVGHSEATPMQIRALGKYRPTVLTHAFDATGRLPVYGGTRGYGPDEYCLKEPEVYTELISDSCGIHVHPEMQQLLLHNKGVDRVVLITDSTYQDSPNPENLKHVKDLNFDPWGGISGSKMTMDQACRNIMTHTNCGIAQAFLMASTNPSKVVGLDEELGSIAVGKAADLVFVDDRFNVQEVMVGGELCHFS
ncbi:MAG: amidohydrolase family protein [Clostridia bacterium]|nr:amidohydrolase family protein [Clostridia bacterium]